MCKSFLCPPVIGAMSGNGEKGKQKGNKPIKQKTICKIFNLPPIGISPRTINPLYF